MKEKILKHRLSSGGVASPNQGCRQRNNCLRGLNEDKGLFSKFILFTRQREGWGKKLCIVIQSHPQRHLTTVYNILLLQNSKSFLPRKRKAKLRTSNITFKLNSNDYIWLRKLSSYASLSDWFTTVFVILWKNHKYLLTINLCTPLLQMKLFWRNNVTFTRKCTTE